MRREKMVVRKIAELSSTVLVGMLFFLATYAALRHVYADQFEYVLTQLGIRTFEEQARIAVYCGFEDLVTWQSLTLHYLLDTPWLVACLSGVLLSLLISRRWLRWLWMFW